MLNTAFPSDALNDARRDDSAGVIGSKQGTNKDTNYDCIVPQTVGGEVPPAIFICEVLLRRNERSYGDLKEVKFEKYVK